MLGAVAWYGCSVYDTSLLLAGDSGASSDAPVPDSALDARGASDAGPETAAPPCPEVSPPEKPTQDDPSDAGDQTFVAALHTLDFGLADAGSPTTSLGYDLDHVYTCCEGGAESCKAAVTGATHCDDPMGRDNSAVHMLSTLASVDSQFNSTTISNRISNGFYSILLQVLHYNGQANDSLVTVALYGSNGVAGDAGTLWNGSDSWTIDDSFVVFPDAATPVPTHLDGNAYVSNGTLVMHVNFPIALGGSSSSTFTIALTAGIITAQIVPLANGTYSLASGTIAGRWNVSDLLQSLQTVQYNAQPVCPGGGTYAFVKGEICQYADIMTDPTADQTGATCDALSVGFGFTADPALLGAVVAASVHPDYCSGIDAGPDDCTKP